MQEDDDITTDLYRTDPRDPTVDMRWPVPAAPRPGEPGLPPDPFDPPQPYSATRREELLVGSFVLLPIVTLAGMAGGAVGALLALHLAGAW